MEKKAEKGIFPQKQSLRSDNALSEDLHTYRDWEDILDNITDMITIHDRNYNIIHANKAAEKLLKLPLLKDKVAKHCDLSMDEMCDLFPCGLVRGAYKVAGLPRPPGCI